MMIPHDDAPTPFHEGELELQERTGKRAMLEVAGRQAIRPFMPDQHRIFFAQLPFIVAGGVDREGWPWAFLITGSPGFIQSPDEVTLEVASLLDTAHPLKGLLENGARLGFLGIELPTRRRNRANGRITEIDDGGFRFQVDQSFGNCPQYIQNRSVDFIREPASASTDTAYATFSALDEDAQAMIRAADTFFVASYVNANERPEVEGVDVSHRGGRPGFVKIDGNTLTIPDYPGNYYFNTLGNFLLNPKAGLVFADFETGDMLLLSGTVELVGEDEREVQAFKGAEGAWRFHLHQGIHVRDGLPFRSKLSDYSPNTLLTGDWKQTQATLDAFDKRDAWRPFRLGEIVDESSVIRSFYLYPMDGAGLLPFEAGQFVTIRVRVEEDTEPVIRNYTISSAPGDNYYRLSVKREDDGLVSRYLHDVFQPGDVIDVRAPSGDFFLDTTETRPAVLMAGGVGITPMMAMARHAAIEGMRIRHLRPITIFHSAQTTKQRAFASAFQGLQQATGGGIRYYSLIDRPEADEKAGTEFNGSGYITANLLRRTLPLDDYDFYLCGPAPFMQAVYDILITLGVRDRRIFSEAFGPASLKRDLSEKTISLEAAKEAEEIDEAEEATIKFTRSEVEHHWKQGGDVLLEVAEAAGLLPEFGCRNGFCGACAVKLQAGSVTYRDEPEAWCEEGEVLLCCAVPAKGTDTIELDL